MQIITWLVAAMFVWTPAREADRDRYTQIASDIASVVYDPAERPLYGGADGRARTALLLASIAAHESTFRPEVDDGRVRGDGGTSWCFMQLHIGSRKTVEGWTGQDLVNDRKLCIRAGLHIAQWSFRMCKGLPPDQMLNAYASGQCGRSVESRQMITRATDYSRHHPMTDEHFLFVEKATPRLWKHDSGRDPLTLKD